MSTASALLSLPISDTPIAYNFINVREGSCLYAEVVFSFLCRPNAYYKCSSLLCARSPHRCSICCTCLAKLKVDLYMKCTDAINLAAGRLM